MKNVLVRSLSGIVYIALIIGSIFAGPVAFGILCGLFAAVGMWEYASMTAPDRDSVLSWWILAVDMVGVLSLALLFVLPSVLFLVMLLYLPVRFVLTLYDEREGALTYLGKSVVGVLYLGLPLMLMTLFMYTEGKLFVLMMFVLIWLNDTGAFCVGCTLGKHRLFPRLSPKKSWEGFWGGMACCVLLAVALYLWLPDNRLFHDNILIYIAYGIVVCVAATWGDLFESLIKRTAGVKDSGNIIPGHGGILDRIDSLLFVSVATALFVLVCGTAIDPYVLR